MVLGGENAFARMCGADLRSVYAEGVQGEKKEKGLGGVCMW